MIITEDDSLMKGCCILYPESKEERDIIFALDESLKKRYPLASQIDGEYEAIFITLYIPQ